MPAAVIRWLRMKNERNPHPIWLTPTLSVQRAWEVRDYLLCAGCEQRFHERGEDWVLRNGYRGGKTFRLQEALLEATPFISTRVVSVFEGSQVRSVDMDQLCYFAASVFWRAAAHSWCCPDGRKLSLELGPYEEDLRLYLLDQEAFPQNVALWITVSNATSPPMAAFFPQRHRLNGFYQHRFAIPVSVSGCTLVRHCHLTLNSCVR